MATEREFELLDDYVANRLGVEEKSAFESKIQADPDLQREYQMQERMVKAIREARKAELKAMLNNVPVPPIGQGGTSVMAKLAMGTVVAGLVATGVYFYADKQEDAATPVEESASSTKKSAPAEANKEKSTVSTSENSEKSDVAESATKSSDVNKISAGETSAKPEMSVYDPTTEAGSEDIEEPAAERRNTARAGAPSIAVQIDRANKNYDFNYQFQDGKLTLYGPFERNLYEIMEFFSDEKRTVFLYYKSNYYLLKDDNNKVQSLAAITDPALIKKLKEYRGN
jgi:hypothetical protein